MYKFLIILFLTSICFSKEIKIVDIDNQTVFCECTSTSSTCIIEIVNFKNTSIKYLYDLGNHPNFQVYVQKGKWIIMLYDKGKLIAKTRVFKIE